MKVVFLDFDGVLNSIDFLQREPGPLDRLDPAAIARLNVIVRRSGAHVVVSSSWRLSRSCAELRQLLEQLGFAGALAGTTPDLSAMTRDADYDSTRCLEIRTWLERSTRPVEGFVVLDDAPLEEVGPNLVRTTFERGLLEEHVHEALRILSGEALDGGGLMNQPPAVLGGGRLVRWVVIDGRHRPTGGCRQIVRGELRGPAAGLAICQAGGEAFYLHGCDAEWNVATDTWHETLEEALEQAEFEYEGVTATWNVV